MNKRAYIFYLLVLIIGFGLAYLCGVRLGKDICEDANNQINKETATVDNVIYNGYWIKSVEGYVNVYEQDGKTEIAQTDIMVTQLSEREQNLLETGIYFSKAEDLFRFLEANSS